MKFFTLLTAAFVMAAPAFADHAVENAAETARTSYRAADDAQGLAEAANRDRQWGGGREELESTMRTFDHRDENLQAVAYASDRLHYELSDLYRAARAISFGGGGGQIPADHRGDEIREHFGVARSYYYQLRSAYYNLNGYNVSQRVHYLFRSMEQSFSRLEYSVTGGILQ